VGLLQVGVAGPLMGISIDQVQPRNINPLQPVQESFHEVNQVQQEKEKLINEARRDYNKVIPLAEGNKVLESRR
jgi:membrane protease subunit HflK